MNRIKFSNSEVLDDDFQSLAQRAPFEVDHFHGVIRLDNGDEHIVHVDAETGHADSTIWKSDGSEWMPSDFDEISCDEWHE